MEMREAPFSPSLKVILEASRRVIRRAVDALRRKLAAEAEAKNTIPPRRRAVLEAMAKARVLKCVSPWRHGEAVDAFWHGPGRLPSPSQMQGLMREAKAMIPTLRELDMDVAPWSGGFWWGLRLSGALVLHGGYPRLQPWRQWLATDLERLPFPGRLSPADHKGRRWLVRCQAWRLPVTDRYSPDIVAGLLAGARREDDDGTWLVLPRTPEVQQLLDWWKISSMKGAKADQVRVSIFYGLLFSRFMPQACAESMRVKKAALCPLLPLAIWVTVWGVGGSPGYLLPNRAGAIPYICGDATRKRRGWTKEYLHRAAAALNVAHVPIEQVAILRMWRQN